MNTSLLGIDFLISGWITAFFLMGMVVYLFIRSRTFDLVVHWVERKAPALFLRRNARRVAVGLVLLLLVVFLFILSGVGRNKESILNIIRSILQDEAQLSKLKKIVENILVASAVLFLLAFFPIFNSLFTRISHTIDTWRETRLKVIKIHNLELLTPDQLADLLVLGAKYTRLAILLILAMAWLTLLFSLYPVTHDLAVAFYDSVSQVMASVWGGFIKFIPNLGMLVTIVIITRIVLKILRFFYDGLRRGRVRYDGIHFDLVGPTYQLLRFLVIAFALVAAFPYIPGSSSPVFKGLSIFVGFLLSLGSTSLVTNIVSGIVLTYTRGLKIGDRIEIAGTEGDVVDRTLLVTRVRTIKNVVVSIPNGMMMQNQIINYSAESQSRGLILNTSITIGYDVPWRQVHKLLIAAARKTPDILQQPSPFVLQTALNDYYVAYEINAFTTKPNNKANIYSKLHMNIQEQFNRAGVEIMSPSYFAYRDGKGTTIPQSGYAGNGKGNGRITRPITRPIPGN
jgi:small-conductance mechanosensitive channel